MLEYATIMKVMNPSRKLKLQSASTLHVTITNTSPEIPFFPAAISLFTLGQKLPSDDASLKTKNNTTAPCAILTSIFQKIDVSLAAPVTNAL